MLVVVVRNVPRYCQKVPWAMIVSFFDLLLLFVPFWWRIWGLLYRISVGTPTETLMGYGTLRLFLRKHTCTYHKSKEIQYRNKFLQVTCGATKNTVATRWFRKQKHRQWRWTTGKTEAIFVRAFNNSSTKGWLVEYWREKIKGDPLIGEKCSIVWWSVFTCFYGYCS